MCGQRTNPLADADPQNYLDGRSLVDKHLRSRCCCLISAKALWKPWLISILFFTNTITKQWHSKALRGPGSTVTWGPPFPSPPVPPPSPSPPPFPSLPLPSLPHAAKRPPKSSYGVWGSAVFHPSFNGVLFPMFCLLVEGQCQILVF